MDMELIFRKQRELADTIAKATRENNLIFVNIPECIEELDTGSVDEHQIAIDLYTKALSMAIQSLDPDVRTIAVKHSENPQPERGSLFGDKFTLDIIVNGFELPFTIDLCLTNCDEMAVNNIRKKIKNDEDTELLNSLTSKYLDLDFTFPADIKADKFIKAAFFDDMIEKIDSVYELHEYDPLMDTTVFYLEQIDLLIKKMKTLQLDKEVKQETLRNNAILLKYFLGKYILKSYSDKYKHIE